MPSKKICFNINSYYQASEIVSFCSKNEIVPILFVRYFIINGFGPEWIKELKRLLNNQFSTKKFKLYADSKKNYGLYINLVEQKIDFIKVDSDHETFIKLKQIAKKNKVLLNPGFSIIDLAKIKNVQIKIKKYLKYIK